MNYGAQTSSVHFISNTAIADDIAAQTLPRDETKNIRTLHAATAAERERWTDINNTVNTCELFIHTAEAGEAVHIAGWSEKATRQRTAAYTFTSARHNPNTEHIIMIMRTQRRLLLAAVAALAALAPSCAFVTAAPKIPAQQQQQHSLFSTARAVAGGGNAPAVAVSAGGPLFMMAGDDTATEQKGLVTVYHKETCPYCKKVGCCEVVILQPERLLARRLCRSLAADRMTLFRYYCRFVGFGSKVQIS